MLNHNCIIVILANVVMGSAMLIFLGALAGACLAPPPALATAPPPVQMIATIALRGRVVAPV